MIKYQVKKKSTTHLSKLVKIPDTCLFFVSRKATVCLFFYIFFKLKKLERDDLNNRQDQHRPEVHRLEEIESRLCSVVFL